MENGRSDKKYRELVAGAFSDVPMPPDFVLFKVKKTTSVQAFASAAEKMLTNSPARWVIFAGVNEACWRTVTCAEVLKRKLSDIGVQPRQRTKLLRLSSEGESPSRKSIMPGSIPRDGQMICILITLESTDSEDAATAVLPEGSALKKPTASARNPWKRVK